MTKFNPDGKYLAKGAYANDGKTKEVQFFRREPIREKERGFFSWFKVPIVIEVDEVGEYVWLNAVWSVHSKDAA